MITKTQSISWQQAQGRTSLETGHLIPARCTLCTLLEVHAIDLNKETGSERQIYDLTYKWKLINKTNKQAKYNQRH